MKKAWEKPKLVVLVRGNSEEMILTNCKGQYGSGDPSSIFNACQYNPCLECVSYGPS